VWANESSEAEETEEECGVPRSAEAEFGKLGCILEPVAGPTRATHTHSAQEDINKKINKETNAPAATLLSGGGGVTFVECVVHTEKRGGK
jgi:hypothetical protein